MTARFTYSTGSEKARGDGQNRDAKKKFTLSHSIVAATGFAIGCVYSVLVGAGL